MDGTDLITSKEIDQYVQSLPPSVLIHHVGNDAFFETSFTIERLALALHNPDVTLALRIHNRLQVLVEMLLAIEGWRMHVLPNGLMAKLEENNNILRITFILHSESTLITLINAILSETCSQISEQVTIALIDYCARSMQVLGEPKSRNNVLMYQRHLIPTASKYQCAIWNAEFRSCVLAATSLLRNFCESFDELSLVGQSRLLDTKDIVLLLVQLIEEPPWTRRRINSSEQRTWEKFIDNQWKEVKKEELLQLTPCEGQCWISLFYLTCNVQCQARYRLTFHRKESLMKLCKFLQQDMIVSQLKILEAVKDYLFHLENTNVPDDTISEPPVIEQIDTLRETVLGKDDWKHIANDQFQNVFSKVTDATDRNVHRFGLLHASNGLDLNMPCEETCSGLNSEIDLSPKIDHVLELRFESQSFILQIDLSFRIEEATMMNTDHGLFKRRKLLVLKKGNEHPSIHPFSTVTVTVPVNHGPSHVLRIENVDLQSTMTSREWRQLGSLEEGIVLQIGFKRIGSDDKHCIYKLDKAFLAHR